MLRTAILGAVFVMCMSTIAHAQKIGIGIWENSTFTTLSWIEGLSGLDWYYNWRPDQVYSIDSRPREVEFVPMIHSARDLQKPIKSHRPIKALLGFNEPDGTGSHQANLSVARAAALWPKLQRVGARLGSPATTQEETLGPGSWQRRFMTEVERRGLRVDFMAVHYYSTDGDVRAFRDFLRKVHAEYKRPIWVTEFAYIDWTRPAHANYEANIAFMRQAIPMLEALPFVERHAWFAAPPYEWQGHHVRINLVDESLRLTPLGELFARFIAAPTPFDVAQANQ